VPKFRFVFVLFSNFSKHCLGIFANNCRIKCCFPTHATLRYLGGWFGSVTIILFQNYLTEEDSAVVKALLSDSVLLTDDADKPVMQIGVDHQYGTY